MPTERREGPVPRDGAPSLYHVSVVPDGARAVVGILHGYADHAARYAHVMEAWAEQGIASVALDMRGHGRAQGPRGYCARFEEYLDDAARLVSLVESHGAGRPAILYGHSFGGLVAIHSALRRPQPWVGLLLTGPYLGRAIAVPRAKLAAARVASRLFPGLSLPAGVRGEHVTHDPVRAARYDDDPLVFKKANARWFTEAVRAQAEAQRAAPSLALPLYMIFGAEDPVARVSAGHAFFEVAGSRDKTFDERPGLRHEVVNEIEWKPVAAAMADWMLRHAVTPGG